VTAERDRFHRNELIELQILFYDSDFDDDNSEEEDVDWASSVLVEAIGDNLFRVPEPTSLTPFGPIGPMLSLGEIIRASPQEGGLWRFEGIQESEDVWTFKVQVMTSSVLQQADLARRLERLRDLNCGWEWCVGNLTIQGLTSSPDREEADMIVSEIATQVKMS
jgi:hypothetical protein